jgi:hypothetical protein
VPKIKADVVNAAPRANLIALLYDVAPDAKGTLISRGAVALDSASEPQTVQVELYPNDYRLEAGHRLGLLIAGSDESWYTPPHSQAEVEVRGGGLELPFLRYERSRFLDGEEAAAMAGRPIADIEDDMGAASVTADFPPPLIPGGPPSSKGGVKAPPSGKPKAARLRMSSKVRGGGRLQVRVAGAGAFPVTVTLKKGRKVVARKTARPRKGAVRVALKLRGKGTYVLTATAKGTGAPKPAKRRITLK